MSVNTEELVLLAGPGGGIRAAKLTKPRMRELFARLDAGLEKVVDIAASMGIDRGTLYTYIERREEIRKQL